MVLTKELSTRWCPSNKKHFENLGYTFTGMADEMTVSFEDMPHSSDRFIDIECDYCHKIFQKQIKKYYSGRSIIESDCCMECRKTKSMEAKLQKYGTISAYVNGNTVEKHKQRYSDTIGKEIFEKIQEIFKDNDYEMISSVYINNHTPIEYICNKHKQYGIQKTTWIHLKEGKRCWYCGIEKRQGENNSRWNGGTTTLNSFLRNVISPWVQDSLKAANYKCDISGENGYFEIHHLYKNFKDIVEETLNTTQIELKPKIGDYAQEELKILSEKCLELHYKYGLGVCILREYHLDFHNFYGRYNNTPEQYYEFKKEMQEELGIEQPKKILAKK